MGGDIAWLTQGLFDTGPAADGAIAQAEAELGVVIPGDYGEYIRAHDAAAGFVGGSPVGLWAIGELGSLNRLAEVEVFAPGLVLIGTNGNLEGYGVDARTTSPTFVSVPMIGLSWDESAVVSDTFIGFLTWLADAAPIPERPPTRDRSIDDQMIYEIHPVRFGGSPTDPANKRAIPLRKYLELCSWWNRQLRAAQGAPLHSTDGDGPTP